MSPFSHHSPARLSGWQVPSTCHFPEPLWPGEPKYMYVWQQRAQEEDYDKWSPWWGTHSHTHSDRLHRYMPRQAVQDDAWRACQPLACQFTPALPPPQVLILSSSFWCSRTLGSSYNWTALAVGKVCVSTQNCVCAIVCVGACGHTFKDDLARLQATARSIKTLYSTVFCTSYFLC